MTFMTRSTHFFAAAALSCLVASVFIIDQVKLGIPMSFVTTMIVTALVSIAVPAATTIAYSFLRKGKGGRFYVFEATCVMLALILGWLAF